ncbi:MAG: uracil-DNA glycosylase [Paenibacillus macerans]|uniref:Uracil DNA glycosylase superfamily protein n=1 Tax=Paenibacillus macerans TaxID=44252 RepID=A0A090Y8K7_PAEMA|nr:uracil-DNA glycosylase [Paenibacillus macerans]KFM94521.1 uracil DNA glycosylase superfamily protein [Paenibacillus macerans]MBS5910149.1 uracil-DNA glycosylase [Paenibacillus macerans]MCY7557815.1 uracil-DNA glycosylase [Paenibacillus macerans]MDU5945989.1 uracil-DNA glycosylase [Paenibacillus macerans]MDU7472366.1 uracil-DNA glycosylase [Paenibacillus macerans]
MDHPFVILPEEQAPAGIQHCVCCELSKQRNRVVWGEGNPQAPLMMILDNPGAREDREGNPFLCGTRETFQLGMREAGIDMSSVYVTYLLKCRPLRAYNKPEARAACFPHLQLQLLQKQPSVLFGFGNVVAQALFPQKENASVKELRGSWHDFQGLPIGFTYHPLAVRRRPNLLKFFVGDLKALKEKWKERSTSS